MALEELAGRRVLDVGCGPRGSLEWADRARVRVGLDPLVDAYRELGVADHAMGYVAADPRRRSGILRARLIRAT